MVQVVYEGDQRWRQKLELGFRSVSHSLSGFKTMSPATCNGHAVRASPQTQTRRRLWLISRDIGSRSFQTSL
ncbi:hypothetical protein HanXRQr2_Chr10g0428791 [Helianthus annuus]|uniref:Uncharacterized protein n=1 Tax=Helianthus annuus TaxID=4232 RepID=A0A9K3N373_HELAN|nr:hypothetical protein HanXRQr2_Chr10g0428791 [Helianthus annuus]KAJ0513006.1 hypothetical protein HanHA300_Chr10g0352561 [Helianthus annuus]KAJ0520714.1 hypothetical protein HanIR_Chr10g0462431 [Helianthus annuus]KAJ0529125.1 hypothetical protein HanHA89_Chr10g0374201 [Helianthus annuus]